MYGFALQPSLPMLCSMLEPLLTVLKTPELRLAWCLLISEAVTEAQGQPSHWHNMLARGHILQEP